MRSMLRTRHREPIHPKRFRLFLSSLSDEALARFDRRVENINASLRAAEGCTKKRRLLLPRRQHAAVLRNLHATVLYSVELREMRHGAAARVMRVPGGVRISMQGTGAEVKSSSLVH